MLASASGTHTTDEAVRTMLSFGMIPVCNAPGPKETARRCAHPTTNPTETHAFNRTACVASMDNILNNLDDTNVTGIKWSGKSLNEWTLHNATTVDYPDGAVPIKRGAQVCLTYGDLANLYLLAFFYEC